VPHLRQTDASGALDRLEGTEPAHTGEHRLAGIRLGLALFAMAIGGFAIGTTEFATMGLLPRIADGTGVSVPRAGRLVSVYAVGVVVGAPVIAAVAARMRRRALLIGLMALFACAHVASALSPNFDTLVIARFISGLPHGAYFGIASVVGAALAPPGRSAWAVSMIMVGLTGANIAGVPLGTWVGQALGWQMLYVLVAVIAVICLLAVFALVPQVRVTGQPSMAKELTAFRRPQVWLAVMLGIVGFGGMFATYSYITPTLTHLSGIEKSAVPPVLALFGIGMTLGTILGGRLADRSREKTLALGLLAMAALYAVFAPLAGLGPAGGYVATFGLGFTGSVLLPALQTRLMDAAPEGQSLAAALNHSTLNVANAIGAWLGGVVLTAGLGWDWPSRVATVLPLLGIVVLLVSIRVRKREAITSGANGY